MVGIKTTNVIGISKWNGGRDNLNQALQKVRGDVLNDALSMLKVLCEQELQRIQQIPG